MSEVVAGQAVGVIERMPLSGPISVPPDPTWLSLKRELDDARRSSARTGSFAKLENSVCWTAVLPEPQVILGFSAARACQGKVAEKADEEIT